MNKIYQRTAAWCLALCLGLSSGAQAQRRAAAPYFRDDASAHRSALSAALRHSRALTVDDAALRAVLATAPSETGGAPPLTLALPLPDGSTGRFAVVETAVMEPALAARFPQIKTYRGTGLDDPTATVRLDMTPRGFHAQILSQQTGTIYIDPASRQNPQQLLSFYRRDMNRAAAGGAPVCEFQPSAADVAAAQVRAATGQNAQARTLIAVGPSLRTYRLAVATTGEYTAFHGGTVALGLAAVVTTVNRVVGVYEKELAVRMQLVANNNQLIYTNAGSDPYTNDDGSAMLSQNQANINTVIGSANYDIGHVFSTGGGGIAGLRVVCNTSNKARGVTGSGAPVGDAFDIDYVAHEMGHQFGGNHTFNSVDGFCGGNRTGTRAYEPGSGSTIMAYAGICDADNLQNNSDAYFHTGSFEEMATFIASTSCGTSTATGNSAPVVTAPAARTLPIGTPFRLTATATDADGDALTYSWEEMDLGPTAALTDAQVANSNVPLFRSYLPSSSPTRYFPSLATVISNTSNPAERLPTVTRTLTFRCTARDQHNGAAGVVGGVNYSANLALPVTSAAGPFLVMAPNTALTWTGGSAQTVTWNVAGTTTNGVNCATVNILLSTDGGLTYPTTLASGVANDGSQAITVPNINTSTARVMVAAADNYFYDISNANFSIVVANQAPVIAAQSFSLPENSPNNTVVGTVAASDPDAGQTLTYAITAGNTGGAFAINSTSGQLTVANTAALDFETRTSFALTVQVTDNGTPATSAAATVTVNLSDVDEVRPAVVISSSAGASGSSTSTAPIPFTVTFSENVSGFVDGDLTVTGGAVTTNSFTRISGTVYTFTVTPAGSGTVTVNVPANVAQDGANNFNTAAAAFSLVYTQSTTAAPAVLTPANGSVTNNNRPPVSGTAPANSTVTVYVDGTSIGTITADAAGNWTRTPTVSLADGPHTVYATAQLSGQTVSANSNTNAFTVDTAPPAAPVVTTPANGSQTTNTQPVYSGTAEPSTTVTVLVDGAVIGTTTANGAGNWSFTQPTALGQGSHTVRSRASDAAGNTSPDSNTNTFTVDSVAPMVSISSPAGASGSTTSTAPIPFTVTFSEAVTGFVAGDLTVGNGTVGSFSGSGTTYTFNVTPAATGPVTVNVAAGVAQDGANNGNTAATQFSITYSPLATAAPVVTTPANGSTTNDNTPDYFGTAPAGSTVTVYVDNSAIGTTTANSSGNWVRLQITPLADGLHTVYATAQLSGQAVSPNSNTNAFTVDTTAPTVALSSATPSGGTTSTSPLSFTATFSENVTGFAAGGISVTNGTVTSGPTAGSGASYTFQVTPTTPNTATTVRVLAGAAQDQAGNSNTASATYSLTYSVTGVVWNGSLSTDWYTAANWTPNLVPDATLSATVPAGTPNAPLIGNGTASALDLTLNNGAALNMSGGTLDLRGNLINNGTFQPTGGTVVLGTTAQTNGPNLLGASRPRFWNLTVNANGLLLSTSAGASARRLVTLNGVLTTQGNPFVLESDATNTALVVNNGGFVLGAATAQRYITPDLNPGPGYRHVSAPTSNAAVADLATTGFAPTVNGAYNGAATPNQVTPFPTVFGYDQNRLTLTNNLGPFDKGWFSPATLTDDLLVGKGYTVNVAADRTLSFTGPLNNGTLSQTLERNSGATAADAGWQLVGNPYPSPLNYSLVAPADRPNLDGAMYVYESTAQYLGSYRSYINNAGNPVVALGQGFFVRVSSGQTSGALTLRNSQRVTTYQNPVFHRTTETRPFVQLTLKPTSGSPLTDELYVYFEQGATDGFDSQYDAEKLANPSGLNLSVSLSATQRLAIDGRPLMGSTTRVLPLAVGVPAPGSYTFAVAQLLNLSTVPTYLRDLQTGALIDLAQQPSYQFTVSNSSALLTGRFELVFMPQRPTATAGAAQALQLTVWPNPTASQGQLNVTLSKAVTAGTLTLRDVVGRTVASRSFSGSRTSLAVQGLARGTYLLSVAAPGQAPATRRVVVE